MFVKELNLNDKLKNALYEEGIKELYPPQTESIEKGLLENISQVVAIPTASGKTLLAILAIFKTLELKLKSKAVYLAPLKALASEKFVELKHYADILGYRISISTGDLSESDKSKWLDKSDIIIATNEKFDSLIRHQVSWLNEISIIISDEVHLINDSSRGPVLEVVLSLIRRNLPNCQILALSATINNADEIAEWLGAELIFSNWRPVKLKEGVWFNGKIKFSNGETKNAGDKNDPDGYTSLALEMLDEDGQALVFTNTRKTSMSTSSSIAKTIMDKLSKSDLEKTLDLSKLIRSSGEKTDLREKLAKAVETGVAFHHAGLAATHRKIIEDGFRNKIIKILCATPTLAAGVNTPSRRVIIRSITRYSMGFGNSPIPVLEYKQMAGRAGRPRYDPYGEAIIIAKNENEQFQLLERYVKAETEEIYSKLGVEPALRSHILAFIAAEYVNDFNSAMEMINHTFYGFQNEGQLFLVEGEVYKALDLLVEAKMISLKEPYIITPFGKRVVELYLDPLSARLIKLGLEMTKDKIDLPNIAYLQLIATTPDIRNYSVRQKEIPILIDLAKQYEEEWINFDIGDAEEFEADFFFTTLKVAKVIDLWINEASEEIIASTFNVTSGDLHSLLNRAEWLLHSSLEITKIFKWKNHRSKLNQILNRLKYGIKEELTELVKIENIGRIRARILFGNNIKTKEDLINVELKKLANLLGPKIAKNIKESVMGKEISQKELDQEGIIIDDQPDNVQSSLLSFFE